METRVERNKMYRKNKRRFYLFIFITIVLVVVSIFKINHSYENLVGISQNTEIFSLKKGTDSAGIIVFGKELLLSKDTIEQGVKFLRDGQKQVIHIMQIFIEKVSN